MTQRPSIYGALAWSSSTAAVSLLLWFDARREGMTREFWITVATVWPAFVLLYVVDRSLQKRKGPEWMSNYHVGLAVLSGAAIVGLVVWALR